MNSRNTTKMVEHNYITCIVRDCHRSADSCNFTNKANSHTKVEIHTRPKLCHFGRYVVRAKLVFLRSFGPVTGLEHSHPGY